MDKENKDKENVTFITFLSKLIVNFIFSYFSTAVIFQKSVVLETEEERFCFFIIFILEQILDKLNEILKK